MIIPRSHTRGFLFADLRGYTAFTELHGDDAARELIARYRALVRREIAAHDGAEIRTEGDSVYVVFDSVADAVEGGLAIRDAAIAASAQPAVHPIPVGIGIHAGETKDGGGHRQPRGEHRSPRVLCRRAGRCARHGDRARPCSDIPPLQIRATWPAAVQGHRAAHRALSGH